MMFINEPPREAHVAEVAPEGDGYVVTCPHGCNLGTSAHAPNEHAASARVRLHKMATTPLDADRYGRSTEPANPQHTYGEY